MINPMDLTGRKILVTGASSGIGRATAIHLSRLGARVIMVARNEEKLKDTLTSMEGEGHSLYPYDLKNIENIESFLEGIISIEGKLNGLVHCAGVGDMRPLQMTKFDFIHGVMLINFYAFVELVRVAAKKKNHAENASFVAVSSVASLKGDKSKTAYCASKGALDSAVRTIAKELAAKKIRVNTVLPGFLKTDMYDLYIINAGEAAVDKNVTTHQYMGLGQPLDAANAIAFLLSDASAFITGTGLIVDGGYLS
jgi:NAD(P)-dependent dehydrogenase (short-subunit alcohol dehydrogenase family)